MTVPRCATADFWFDPSCPYTWLTSQWLVEVTKVRPVEVRWNLMSLSVLNEGREDDPEGDPEGWLRVPVRICAAVRQEYGQEALARFYTALWTGGSEPEEGVGREWLNDLRDSLERAGLPPALAAAGTSEAYDAAVRASHDEAVSLVGPDAGTPVIAVDRADGGGRTAFFGPVISRVPTGQEAARLWDGVLLTAGTAGFCELRSRQPLSGQRAAPATRTTP